MAQLIDLPDGTTGEFPDNMSSSDIEAVLQKQYPTPPSGPTTGDKALGAGNTALEQYGSGATLGVAPYLSAAGSYAAQALTPGMKADWSGTLASIKQSEAQHAAEHPVAATVGNVAGSILPLALTGGESLPAVIAKNAGAGAIQGAAGADSLADVPAAAGIGAVAGGAGAGVVGGAAKVIGSGVKSMARDQLAKDIVSPDTVSRATAATAPRDVKVMYEHLKPGEYKGDQPPPTFAALMSNVLKSPDSVDSKEAIQNAGPAFSTITDFLKQAQPSVAGRVMSGAAIGAGGGASAVGYNAIVNGKFDPTQAAELIGGGAMLGATRGAGTYATQAAKNAAVQSVIKPSATAAGTTIGNVAGRGFSNVADYLHKTNIANTIQQDQQDGMPPEATDYKLQQTNADYRKMKQGD
jgi:hypothetical protein